ncbi:neuroligin-4, Y-linked-like [Anoplophora glabripennis]|uniref:neuroligin-4, Y-linked-like n=1 Tax=Anoplophora glabripennis TaxID=217634 RepID=UPI0008756851|nr:neuroligin-4, Y-linked-like [Anoplophora glabripennis]
MGMKSRGILRILVFAVLILLIECDNSFMKNAKISTRIVQTRYGRLQGLIVPMDGHRYLKPIEVFLGVPYATPPVQSNRFSPTRTPSPWDGIRVSDKMGPVCPQKLPDISNETAALEKMPRGRLEYLKRLLPYLQNQSEDCLYLNIYTPAQGKFVARHCL